VQRNASLDESIRAEASNKIADDLSYEDGIAGRPMSLRSTVGRPVQAAGIRLSRPTLVGRRIAVGDDGSIQVRPPDASENKSAAVSAGERRGLQSSSGMRTTTMHQMSSALGGASGGDT